MAMAFSLRRLSRHLLPARNIPSSCRVFPAQFSGTIESQSGSRTKKVADRLVRLFAIDPDGNRHSVVGLTGQTLLKALANAGLIDPESHRLEDIYACSAECEVRMAQEWLDKLPPPSEDEIYVLKCAALRGDYDKHARLGCQILLKPDLEGMVVAVPEPRPWDIP